VFTACHAGTGLNLKWFDQLTILSVVEGQYGNSNLLAFGHFELEIVSSFGIRISDFDLLFGDAKAFARSCDEFWDATLDHRY